VLHTLSKNPKLRSGRTPLPHQFGSLSGIVKDLELTATIDSDILTKHSKRETAR